MLPQFFALALLSSPLIMAPESSGASGGVDYIVNGSPTEPGAFPFMASLLHPIDEASLRHHCGATLITPRCLLTAAHCPLQPGGHAIVGRRDLDQRGGESVLIAEVHRHPGYSPLTQQYDLAVLRLVKDLGSEPVILDFNPVETGSRVLALGWGATEEDGPQSASLLSVEMSVIERGFCGAFHIPVGEGMLCAGDPGKDACQGDSGGPLLRGEAGSTTQVGIVSWGVGCAREGYFGVYTRLAFYRDWILTTLESAQCGDARLASFAGPP